MSEIDNMGLYYFAYASNLNRKQMAELCESMDLSVENINEILDRAQEAWEDVKSRT